ncbi:PaaI family thioesterase [Lysinibacillus sphaericus]|uniref:PaaI family thioesterase n=1 Tax=Lysinibacillus sphaericus TaxID=1421 RepID=UPI001CBCCB7B|nr:PaaI family thioesterase [Lysinibacillus sphaericus]
MTLIDLKRVIAGEINPPACDQTLGIQVKSAIAGKAVCSWEVDERFLNGHQVVMGGFITSAADITMAYSMASILENNQGFASINLQTTFLRPLHIGTTMIESIIVKQGRKTCYVEASVFQNEQCIAKITSSIMIL